jgi:hypothetical protein
MCIEANGSPVPNPSWPEFNQVAGEPMTTV